jgi:glycosyltransferase involved in cell wall biosynthesis
MVDLLGTGIRHWQSPYRTLLEHSACIAPSAHDTRPAGEKLISVVSGCYNEEENIRECYEQVKKVFAEIGRYRYEHIFIDNASKDKTVAILREIAAKDTNVKVIVNARNFGHIRSGYHALLNARGDAVISIVSDLQDPPDDQGLHPEVGGRFSAS